MPAETRRSAAEQKMVLVLRAELRLTPGKAAVQVAHAAVALVEAAEKRHPADLSRWRSQGAKKIALTAPTLGDLESIQRRARGLGVPSVLIQDAGLTEVPPGTVTILGLGPAVAELLDQLTGELPLL